MSTMYPGNIAYTLKFIHENSYITFIESERIQKKPAARLSYLFAEVTLRDKGVCILYSIFLSSSCPRATDGNLTLENLTIQVQIFSFLSCTCFMVTQTELKAKMSFLFINLKVNISELF